MRDVRKQWKRNRTAFKMKDEDVPVYPTIASQFNDPGLTWMFVNLNRLLREKLHLGGASGGGGEDAAVGGPAVVGGASAPIEASIGAKAPPTNPRVNWNPSLDTS